MKKVKKTTKAGSAILAVVMLIGVMMCAPFRVSAEETYYDSEYYVEKTYHDFKYYVEEDNTCTLTKYIGSAASVTIPYDILGHKVTFLDYTFKGCTSVKSIKIPDGVTRISASTFIGCDNLTSITAYKNSSVYSSVDGVLFNKAQDTLIAYPIGKAGDYQIPDGVTSIGNKAFGYCKGLTNITIPESVTWIGNDVFSCCTNLTSITIHDGVSSIGKWGLSGCTNLTNITIPESVSWIDDKAFYGCKSLTIYGYEDSYAQEYADEHNIPFIVISDDKIFGDVNGDGEVSVFDVTLIQKYIVGGYSNTGNVGKPAII